MSTIQELCAVAGIDPPKDGDVALGCAHKPNLGCCHIFLVDNKSGKGGMGFTDERGFERRARWVFLCDDCDAVHGADFNGALDRHEIPLGVDLTWPEKSWRRQLPKRTRDEARAEAQAQIEELTPPGWKAELVVPPWHHEHKRSFCRACGITSATATPGVLWGLATLTRRDEEKKTLYFTFAMTCSSCKEDDAKMRELCARAFEAKH